VAETVGLDDVSKEGLAGPGDGEGGAVEGAELEVAHFVRLVKPRLLLCQILRDDMMDGKFECLD
jgi:hypothetical protein